MPRGGVVKPGARDYCRHCNEVITLRPSDVRQGFRDDHWVHVESDARDCNIEGFRHRAAPKAWCWESMKGGSWYSSHCGRPVKDESRFMCGIHASHERKRTERQTQDEQAWEISNYAEQEAQKICDELKKVYDLTARPYQNPTTYKYNGEIIVDPEKLMNILEETF